MLVQYKAQFYIKDGRGGITRTEQIVSAINQAEAQKLIEAQYGKDRVQWIFCSRV